MGHRSASVLSSARERGRARSRTRRKTFRLWCRSESCKRQKGRRIRQETLKPGCRSDRANPRGSSGAKTPVRGDIAGREASPCCPRHAQQAAGADPEGDGQGPSWGGVTGGCPCRRQHVLPTGRLGWAAPWLLESRSILAESSGSSSPRVPVGLTFRGGPRRGRLEGQSTAPVAALGLRAAKDTHSLPPPLPVHRSLALSYHRSGLSYQLSPPGPGGFKPPITTPFPGLCLLAVKTGRGAGRAGNSALWGVALHGAASHPHRVKSTRISVCLLAKINTAKQVCKLTNPNNFLSRFLPIK